MKVLFIKIFSYLFLNFYLLLYYFHHAQKMNNSFIKNSTITNMKYRTTFARNTRLEMNNVFFRISRHSFFILSITGIMIILLPQLAQGQSSVTIREADEAIPTYLSGPPDPNPMFFFGKQSQGAEGRIYPYKLYDNLTNQKSDKTYPND